MRARVGHDARANWCACLIGGFAAEPVGDDHVDPGRLHELRDLDLLDVAEVGDELERQVAGGLACAALAHRVPLDHPEPLVEVREHAQALVDEPLAGTVRPCDRTVPHRLRSRPA